MKYKEEYQTLLTEHVKLSLYVGCYGHIDGECLGCGQYIHDGYVCGNCGLDPTDEECFEEWIKEELDVKNS